MTRKIKKRGFKVKERNTLKSRKNKLWLLASISSMSQKKKRYNVSEIMCFNCNKATLPATTPSQKTSVDLGNLYTGD